MNAIWRPSHPSRFGELLTPLIWTVLAGAALPVLGEPAPTARVEVRGRLVDAAGKVPAGAEVGLLLDPEPYLTRRAWLAGAAAEPAKWVKVGENGDFALRAKPGFHILTTRASDHVEVGTWLAPLIGVERLSRLVVPAAKGLRIRVLAADGRALPGALVVLRERAEQRPYRIGGRRLTPRIQVARTGDEGSASFAALENGTREVYVAASGHVPKTVSGPNATGFDVRLDRGSTRMLEARLDGKLRAGVLLLFGDLAVPIAETGEDGRVTVFVAANEELKIQALDRAGASGSAILPAAQTRPADDQESAPNQPIVIDLASPSLVKGQVVDARTREGIPGALVWRRSRFGYVRARTDRQGFYRLAITTGSPHTTGSPYISGAADGYLQKGARAQAASGLTLALEPAGRISGTVIDVDGLPIAEVDLEASAGRQRGRGAGPRRASSDSKGHFDLVPVARGVPVTLVAKRVGFAPARLEVTVPELGDGDAIEIVLQRGRMAFGQVIDTDEEPITGATVRMVPAIQSGRFDRRSFARLTEREARETSSDRHGKFSFEDLGEESFELAIERAGFAAARVPGLRMPPGEGSVDLGAIVLLDGMVLSGVVVDEDGGPLADAEVTVRDQQGLFSSAFAQTEEPVATSGADGRFRVADLRPGSRVSVSVVLKGYVSASLDQIAVPAEEPLRIVLPPAAEVVGIVVDEGGSPIAGARVSGLQEQGGASGSFQSSDEMTDAEGRFRLGDLSPGRWTLIAAVSGKGSGEVTGIEVVAGAVLEPVRIVVDAGHLVSGRITAADGTPIAGARIQKVSDQDYRSMLHGQQMGASDDDGSYRVEGLSGGQQSLRVSHAEYREVVRDVLLEAAETRLDVTLDRGLSVSGSVVDPEGNPVAGAAIFTESAGRSSMARFTLSGTDDKTSAADGRFEITGLDRGKVTLRASKEGFADAEATLDLEARPVRGVELRLTTGGTIAGQVRGIGFDELSAIQIIVSQPTQGRVMRPMVATVDHEGRFRLGNVPPGEWLVMAVVGQMRMEQETVSVPEGGEVPVELDFGEGVSITGVVLRGGQPMAGLRVSARGVDVQSIVSTTSDPSGRFRLGGLEAGRYEITVAAGRFGSRRLAGREIDVVGGEEMVIEVSTTTIAGRIVGGDSGAGIAGAFVRLEAAEPETGRLLFRGFFGGVRSGQEGSFEVTDVPPGSWRVVVEKEGYSAVTRDVEVFSGIPVAGLEIALESGAGLVLTALRPDGQPATEIRVAAFDAGDRPVISGLYAAGESGQIRIPTLPEGRFTLWIVAAGSASTRVEVTLPGPPIAATLAPAGELRVRVPAARGAGRSQLTVSDAQGPVRVIEWFGMIRERWDLLSGEATITLGPGPVRLAVELPDGSRLEGEAVITPGQTTEVELR